MARDLNTAASELDNFSVVHATLVHLDWYQKDDNDVWVSSPLYLTSSIQNITHDGNIYQALGSLAVISGIQESTELQSYDISLSLSGIPVEFMADLFQDISFATGYVNRPAKIYLAFLDTDYIVIGDPVLIYSGQMDAATVQISADTVEVQLKVHSRLTDWEVLRGGRFNHGSQSRRFPADTGFQFLTAIQNTQISFPGGIYVYTSDDDDTFR